MALFNDTYCQLCERSITKEQWFKHLYSIRHLHREENGYWPVSFPQSKLTGNEGSKLEKAFWEMIFGSEIFSAVYGFLKTYFRLVTTLNDYVKYDDDDDDDNDDDDKDFWYHYRDNMIDQ